MGDITIKDIARLSGVGVSTVSRAINNHPDINQETKQMIMDVIRENNYIPNNSARNLKRSDANTIAVLIKGITNPLFNEMIDIIESETRKRKYSFILQRVEEQENELDIAIELTKEKRLKGIVFLGGTFAQSEEKRKQLNVPFVLSTVGIIREVDGSKCSSVSLDNLKESCKIVDYLCDLGHKRIAIITSGSDDQSIGELRFLGYKKALQDHGIPFDEKLVKHMDGVDDKYDMQTGYRLAKELLTEGEEFTALYCIADRVAIGACRAIRDVGKRIPEDISVVGFDGIEIGAYYSPSLTTLRQPVEKMAKETIDILFEVIKKRGGHRQVILEGELLERESTRRIK